jgi:fermentation-respiration switch protein FrsA (DUF1100 family)
VATRLQEGKVRLLPVSAGRIAALLAAAYVAICAVVFFARNRLAFPVRGGPAGDPRSFRLPDGESVVIRTADGQRLSGWLLPPGEPTPKPWPALLWFHGNGETVAGLAAVLKEFRPAHAALLATDYRGYGASTGRATVANVTQDADAMIAYLGSRSDLDAGRVVVYGRSVGTGPAVHAAATHTVTGLVLESAFPSLRAMAREHFPMFPSFLAGGGFDNLEAIRRVSCPVLFVHGDQDRTIPIAMGRALAARAPRVEKFVVIPRADHNDTYDAGGAEYARRVREFVERVTEPRR